MIRNLKALGLALVAVLAMSAMAASAAQAETADFSAAEYPAHIDGVTDGFNTFEMGGLKLTCEAKGTAELKEESSELTATVEYHTCHVVVLGVTFPITVDMNECHYLFTAGTYAPTETNGAGAAHGTVHITCPEKKQIEITVFKAGGAHTPENIRCTIDVAAQTPTEGSIDYFNETTESVMAVTLQATEVKVKATKTATGSLCPETKEETATYNGSVWVKATNKAHTAYIDTTVTGTP
jgi:hypothetical protein